jgi:hypothetical protein
MGGADVVVGESEIEIENVPNLATDEGYKVACESIGLGGKGRDPAEYNTYIPCIAFIYNNKTGS